MDAQEVLKQGKRLLHDCSELLLLVEQGDSSHFPLLTTSISQLSQITSQVSALKENSQVAPVLQRKIENFIESSNEMNRTSEKYILQQQETIRSQLEREELLKRRDRNGEFELNMEDQYEKEMDLREKSKASLKHSHNLADSVLSSSYEVLQRLQSQNELLRGIRGRLTDLRSSVGISDQLMRTIERRLNQDKWIVYGGMIGVVLLIIILYYFFAG